MTDFFQNGKITTLHDLGTTTRDQLEWLLGEHAVSVGVALILPVTAGDMRAAPFDRIMQELKGVGYIRRIVVTLGQAPSEKEYRETCEKVAPLGDMAQVLWTDGKRVKKLYQQLEEAGLFIGSPGKGRAVWTAFGYLLGQPDLEVFALHDCDIVDYDRIILARLCLPIANRQLDFEFCKAYYARYTNRLHGRVVRLMVTPLVRALMSIEKHNGFLEYIDSFRYPLSGEFALTSAMARYNRIPSDWGLEVGTLAEVYRNTSSKRVCQVDLCQRYEHKHQALSLEDPAKGLIKMATDISLTFFRTLASMGTVMTPGFFSTLRSAYLRAAQDAIRHYTADAIINHLEIDRHGEETAVEGFAQSILMAGQQFLENPLGGQAIPNWNRVISAFPDFPARLQQSARDDRDEFLDG